MACISQRTGPYVPEAVKYPKTSMTRLTVSPLLANTSIFPEPAVSAIVKLGTTPFAPLLIPEAIGTVLSGTGYTVA